MPSIASLPILVAATDGVRHRVTSGLVESFTQWWQMPAVVCGGAAAVGLMLWLYRRDAAELPRGVGLLLAALRLAALAALAAALLDIERTAEHELVFPSRVAVLVDSSASMTLTDPAATDAPTAEPPSRSLRALEVLDAGGLLEALAPRHEVAVWRFDADAERVATLPLAGAAPPPVDPAAAASEPAADWRERLGPQGFETRLGEALGRVLDQETRDALAGVIVLSDGANNAGVDPAAAVAALAKAGVAVHPLGIGSEVLPANLRVADLLVPARVFPGDRFAVTAYLQPQGMEGRTVRVELAEQPAGTSNAAARTIDTVEAVLAADGELTAVRFDVPGLEPPGRRTLLVRAVAATADSVPADDVQTSDLEVVDRVTQVLLMAGGPGREYQFLRNVLQRDPTFAVDVLLGTAAGGVSQDARRILDGFPDTDAELAEYDAVVAIDFDWRRLDAAAQTRLERWVSRESGGLVLSAGPIAMSAWLSAEGSGPMRNLHPVELRRASQIDDDAPPGGDRPQPLLFTRDGRDAEFLWLAPTRAASEAVWAEFPGVFSCYDAGSEKPGATVYARVDRAGMTGPPYLVGQFYGSGSVLYVGSGELWRLRALDDAAYERIATQVVRHVSQGRLLRGSRRARLLVERDRYPVGASITVRLVTDEEGAQRPVCQATGPDGSVVPIGLAPEPSRPGMLQGAFVASREGGWQIAVDLDSGATEPLTKRIQARLPDRELARPKLDRPLLAHLATATGGAAHFLDSDGWSAADAARIAAQLPDRSRREYQSGSADTAFKRWLNGVLLGTAVGLLCLEWIIRRLAKLA